MSQGMGQEADASAVEAAVRHYYDRVDAGDVAGVLDCFTDDAVYHRPGYEPMVGREALAAFYGGERVIADGRHELDAILVDGHAAAVRGRFVGTLKDGRPARVGFADFWVFDEGTRAVTRHSYFDSPAV